MSEPAEKPVGASDDEEEKEKAHVIEEVEEEFELPPHAPPVNTNTFGLPEDDRLLRTFTVYNPPMNALRKLRTERGRTIFAEAFIENPKLGTLAKLCVRAMSKHYGDVTQPATIREDAELLRTHYKSLDINLPLENCYQITNVDYWRRVVLAKDEKKGKLAMKKQNEHPWKNHGISLKYVELVEACPAEFWPEEKMYKLAMKIKDFITHMHIKHLQSLEEYSFEQYFGDMDDGEEEDDESIGSQPPSTTSTSTASAKSAETDKLFEEEEMGEEEEQKTDSDADLDPEIAKRKSLIKEELKMAIQAEKDAIRAAKHQKHLLRARRLERREARREKREKEAAKQEAQLQALANNKKNKNKKIKSIFDIDLTESEEDIANEFMEKVPDKRNIEKVLNRKKRYEYWPQHCHHIDLSFVRYFPYMDTLTFEFQGPKNAPEYHTKHFNFSYDDITQLAEGLDCLQDLKTFRLRNSRMDNVKLEILILSLRTLPLLHTLDFGNDDLQDDCGLSLYRLMRYTTSIKTLELEGNFLSTKAVQKLADSLSQYKGNLDYLGLALNPLGDNALHSLVTAMIKSKNVHTLNLMGIVVSDSGVLCCISRELFLEHEPLLHLNIACIKMTYKTAWELIRSLQSNHKVLSVDCRACDLDMDLEVAIELLCRRNKYILENPYIGDTTKTEKEIEEFVSRIKNPILLDCLAEVEKRRQCMLNRVPEFSRIAEVEEIEKEESVPSLTSLDILLLKFQGKYEATIAEKSNVSSTEEEELPSFVYEPNTFNEEQFHVHAHVPGTGQRFHYMKIQKYGRAYNERFEDYLIE